MKLSVKYRNEYKGQPVQGSSSNPEWGVESKQSEEHHALGDGSNTFVSTRDTDQIGKHIEDNGNQISHCWHENHKHEKI